LIRGILSRAVKRAAQPDLRPKAVFRLTE
jgi:hypothetical protein